MRILSLNCRNWTRDTDRDSTRYWKTRMSAMERMIISLSPDIICFQELVCPAWSFIPDGYKRVGVSVSHHIYIRKTMTAKDKDFHIFHQSCIVDGVRIVCVHGRWKPDEVDSLCEYLLGLKDKRVVAIGDFNIGLAALKYRGLPPSARESLGIPQTDTFANFDKEESHGEIDHAFLWGVTPKSYKVITGGYGSERISDHYPIVLDY